ncbi:MAG: efflux RND transporter periplasmic adaptor subunit, partial [Chloroflexota bacterium]|nr:efflux RND transporter periplasmic adaptor subunit [Chloroflexota bacterium]
MKRIAAILGVLAIVALATYFGYVRNASSAESLEGERIPVERGTIEATVNATGNVEANKQISLSFRAPGHVANVLIAEGDLVQEGERLARLDTTDLEFAVAQAESNVAAQQAQLRQLQAPASESEIQAAEATLESARSALTQLESGPDPEDLRAAEASLASARQNLAQVQQGANPAEVEAARAQLSAAQLALQRLEAGPDGNALTAAQAELDRAEAAVRQAQAAYDEVSYRPDISGLPQSLQLEQATINYEAAKANYDTIAAGATEDELEQARANVASAEANLNRLLAGSDSAAISAAEAQVVQAETNLTKLRAGTDAAELAAARAQVEEAEANLERLRAGPDEEEMAVAEASLRQAEIALEQARADLAGAELLAPFTGTIATIAAREGELITSGQPMITLVDLTGFRIEVEVDEIDIGQVRVGDSVTILVDSLPNTEIASEIDYVAPVPTIAQGVVTYPVRILLDADAAPGVRVGMTANVNITTETREGALLVPNRAIEIDRNSGK